MVAFCLTASSTATQHENFRNSHLLIILLVTYFARGEGWGWEGWRGEEWVKIAKIAKPSEAKIIM